MSFKDNMKSAGLGVVSGGLFFGVVAAVAVAGPLVGLGVAGTALLAGAGGMIALQSFKEGVEGQVTKGFKLDKPSLMLSSLATVSSIALVFNGVTGQNIGQTLFEKDNTLDTKITEVCEKGGEQKLEHNGAYLTVTCPHEVKLTLSFRLRPVSSRLYDGRTAIWTPEQVRGDSAPEVCIF